MTQELADRLETWAEIRDDDAAVVRCAERWKEVAAVIGCELHGFNDGRSASFRTPDGGVIEIGPKLRAILTALRADQRPSGDEVEQCQHARITDEPNGWTVCADCDANIARWASRSALPPTPPEPQP